jgi:zinc-ribbon domain
MAFCNSCGATLNSGAQFCNKCGTVVTGAPLASATPIPAATPTAGGSAIKIVLIVIAVIASLGVLGLATIGVIGWHFARHSHVTHEGDHVKVETPFGSVETSKDPAQVASDLGIDIYPGAVAQKSGAASATFAGVRTVAASFQTSDSPDKVCSFYKSKFPNANVTTTDSNHCTIVSTDKQNVVTINVEAHVFKEPNQGDYTAFQISSVTKKSSSNN